jgi:hypothetical protein
LTTLTCFYPFFSYQIRYGVDEKLGGQMYVTLPLGITFRVYFDDVYGNPPVQFEFEGPPVGSVDLDGRSTAVMTSFYSAGAEVLQLTSGIITGCGPFDPTGLPEQVVVGTTTSGAETIYWIHTPTFKLLQNDLVQPLEDGGKMAVDVTTAFEGAYDRYEALCSTVERTFLNEDSCFLSDSACATTANVDDVAIPLTITNFERIYNVTGMGADGTDTRYLYRIENLKQDSSFEGVDYPCEGGKRSRWVKVDTCTDDVEVEQSTKDIFIYLISQLSSADPNMYIRDVLMPNTNINGLGCDSGDLSTFDFKVLVNGECWENTHPDNYQVYDMTYWTTNHRGNRDGFYPIYWPAGNGTFVLRYPDSHRSSMSRWHDNKVNFGNIGRYGDTASIRDMPAGLQRDEIADEFCEGEGSRCGLDDANPVGPFLVCGSPFEVANSHSINAGTLNRGGFDMATTNNQTAGQGELFDQLETAWMEIALTGQDQLRQRVAWALSQILVISPGSIGADDFGEMFLNYYDIFVRHAFGNYFDILKEVTYSPMMSEMLTYIGGRSTGYNFGRDGTISYADENYAREIMQLFSIGLYVLNNDGTRKVEDGQFVRSYTNEDITEYAKVYTGFVRKVGRGNIETDTSFARNRKNYIDPMDIRADFRDHLPKVSLFPRFQYTHTHTHTRCSLQFFFPSLVSISSISAMGILCAMTCLRGIFCRLVLHTVCYQERENPSSSVKT